MINILSQDRTKIINFNTNKYLEIIKAIEKSEYEFSIKFRIFVMVKSIMRGITKI